MPAASAFSAIRRPTTVAAWVFPPPPEAAASAWSPGIEPRPRQAGWAAALALFALAFLAYGPSLSGAQFLNFDDNFYFGPDHAVFQAATFAANERGVFAGRL